VGSEGKQKDTVGDSYVTVRDSCVTVGVTHEHVECHSIKTSNLNQIGLFSTERGKRDVAN